MRVRALLVAAAIGAAVTVPGAGAFAASSTTSANGAKAGGSGSTISLVVLDSSDSLPHYGGQVTFDVSTTATDQPWVNLSCYQNGVWVSGQWQGFFPGYTWGQEFTLGPTPSWQGGDADCTARLVKFGSNGKETTLATTSFHVEA